MPHNGQQPVWVSLPLIEIYGILKKYLNISFLDSETEIIVIFILLVDGIG